MLLELKHNGKKYHWVSGKEWWESGRVLSLFEHFNTIFLRTTETEWQGTPVDTYHTPDQLVALGYMEEVKEAEWMPKAGEAIVVYDRTDSAIIDIFEGYVWEDPYPWKTRCSGYMKAQQIPELLQSEIKKLLNS